MLKKVIPLMVFSVLLLAPAGMQHAFAGNGEYGGCTLQFDTELLSLNLVGGPYPIPLASDPANLLGDSVEGYGFVNSEVTITLSSQRSVDPGEPSLGEAFAFQGFGPASIPEAETFALIIPNAYAGVMELCEVDPEMLDGQEYVVDSFFDVFFDITVTDVDTRPGRDFAGMPDGASVFLQDNGPAFMQSNHQAIFDKDTETFGLIPPPEVAPYIGHFQIEIPLGGDINGNGEADKIKFTIASHAAGDENRQFIQLPDGTVLETFDSAAFLQGAVVDESTDPPFTLGMGSPNAPSFSGPGALTGPTQASSTLLNPLVATLIGGELLPIDSTSLLLAGIQTSAMWILPIAFAGAGFAAFKLRKYWN